MNHLFALLDLLLYCVLRYRFTLSNESEQTAMGKSFLTVRFVRKVAFRKHFQQWVETNRVDYSLTSLFSPLDTFPTDPLQTRRRSCPNRVLFWNRTGDIVSSSAFNSLIEKGNHSPTPFPWSHQQIQMFLGGVLICCSSAYAFTQHVVNTDSIWIPIQTYCSPMLYAIILSSLSDCFLGEQFIGNAIPSRFVTPERFIPFRNLPSLLFETLHMEPHSNNLRILVQDIDLQLRNLVLQFVLFFCNLLQFPCKPSTVSLFPPPLTTYSDSKIVFCHCQRSGRPFRVDRARVTS